MGTGIGEAGYEVGTMEGLEVGWDSDMLAGGVILGNKIRVHGQEDRDGYDEMTRGSSQQLLEERGQNAQPAPSPRSTSPRASPSGHRHVLPESHSTRAGAHHRVLSPRVCTRQALSPLLQMDVAALRAEIKAWERDFKALHGRQPSIDEIRQQPRIGTCSPLSFSISFPSLTTHNAQPKSTNSTRNFPNLPLLLLVLPPPPHPSLPSTLPLLLPLLQNPNHVQALPHYCTNPVQSRPNPHLPHLIPSLP